MPAVLLTILSTLLASFLSRILLGAGLAVFSYTQINKYMDQFIAQVASYLNGLPVSFLQLASLGGLDFYISVVLSALSSATFIFTMKVFVARK